MTGRASQVYHLILTATLFATLLAGPTQGATNVVSDEHLDSVRDDQGANAPFAPWGKVLEKTTLYLHRDAKLPPDATPAPGSAQPTAGGNQPLTTASPDSDYYVDYERPRVRIDDVATAPIAGSLAEDVRDTDDKKVIIETLPATAGPVVHGYARFTVPTALSFTEDVRVYGFEYDIYANCGQQVRNNLAQTGTGNPSFNAELQMRGEMVRLDLNSAGAWVRGSEISAIIVTKNVQAVETPVTDGDTTGTAAVYRFTGTASFGNPDLETGTLLEAAKNRLQFAFRPGFTGSCVLHWDTNEFPSVVRVTADTGRISPWVENLDGEDILGVPAGNAVSADLRKFVATAMHVSSWPNLNSFDNTRDDLTDGPTNYQDDFFDAADPFVDIPNAVAASELRIRIRDMQSFLIVSGTESSQVQALARSATVVGNSVNRLQYTFFYPESLPEGDYRYEIFSSIQGVVPSPVFTVGLKGFTVELVGATIHAVNPREATEFRFKVTNVGAEDDTVTLVPTAPGGNWVADLEGSQQFLRANGGTAEVVLRVTPPDTATAGATKAITVTATSALFPLEVEPVTKTVEVRIVAPVTRGVDITAAGTEFVVQPGTTATLGGIRLTNTGSAEDTFVVTPSAPSGTSGYSIQVIPPSRTVFAQSTEDFAVQVRVPSNAVAGQEFALTLKATRLGDNTITDTAIVTVQVLVDHAFSATARDEEILVRQDEDCPPFEEAGATAGQLIILCVADYRDTISDKSVVFRIDITNPSPVADTFRISGIWSFNGQVNIDGTNYQITDETGNANCDGSTGVKPELWNYEYGDATQIDGTPSRVGNAPPTAPLERLTVPAGATISRYVELGYAENDSCDSVAARFTVSVRSANDPGQERVIPLEVAQTATGDFVRNNDYSGAVNDVAIELDVQQEKPSVRTTPGQVASHFVRAVNTGNEHDTVVVTVPTAQPAGWTRSLDLVSTAPSAASCTSIRTDGTRWDCFLGVGDEALFRVIVSPAANVPLGTTDLLVVTATSGGDGRVNDNIQLLTTTTGEFIFSANELDATREGVAGATVALPFTIENQGTEGDSFTVSPVIGEADWNPRLSVPDSSFVPADSTLVGTAVVTIPAGTPAGSATPFRFQVAGEGTGQIQLLDFTVVTLAPTTVSVAGTPSNEFLVATPGDATDVTVRVTDTGSGGSGRVVTVTADKTSLPVGWDVTPATRQVTLATSGSSASATATFTVDSPDDALGTSRVPLRLTATSTVPSTASAVGDVFLNMADTYGVTLDVNGTDNQTIVPGGQVVYKALVTNNGLTRDTYVMSNSRPSDGWTVLYSPTEFTLDPLETREIEVFVTSPVDADPATQVTVQVLVTSRSGTAVDRLELVTTVGYYTLTIETPTEVPRIGPEERATVVFNLTNVGTVPDEVAVTFAVPAGFEGAVALNATPDLLQLEPGETQQIAVTWEVGTYVPSDVGIAVPVTFASILDPDGALTQPIGTIRLHIIRNLAVDVDSDEVRELLIDRDENATNGYEEFREPNIDAGRTTTVIDPVTLMGPDAIGRHTVSVALNNTTVEVVDYLFDGDGEGRRDWLLDTDGNGVADLYFDPDRGTGRPIPVAKDVTGDGHPELFIDLDGIGGFHLDAFYDAWEAEWGDLIEVDIDSDGNFDYIVDLNSNGRVDLDEPILYGGPDGDVIKIVEKRDVDGNGELDTVVDVDGDGIPEYFIPNGKTTGIPLTMEDVNGDGVDDWTYDSNGDGTRDSYYDPVSNTVGRISPGNAFYEDLKDYYYIPVLFALVLVLFVVLVAVTRK